MCFPKCVCVCVCVGGGGGGGGGGFLYPNKLQSQEQVRANPTRPGRLLIYGMKWRIIQTMYCIILLIYGCF